MPSLKLGYAPPTTSTTPRYARSKTRHDRKRVPTVTEAHSDPTENSSLLESEEVTVAAAVTQLTPDLEPDDDSILQQMRAEMQRLLTDNIKLREENYALHLTKQSFLGKVHFYTGLPSFSVLQAVLDLISPHVTDHAKFSLSLFQKLILVLMRLRLNLSVQDLAYRFNISKSTVSRTFKTVIAVMFAACILFLCGPIEIPCD